MFSPERQGFFPALWVQLLETLQTQGGLEEWGQLTTR